MPKYDKNQSFVNLTTTYLRINKNTEGLTTSFEANLRSRPLSFVRSGFYDYPTSTLNNRGSRGYYWPSRANSAIGAFNLSFASGYIYPQSINDKAYGFSLRCVAR